MVRFLKFVVGCLLLNVLTKFARSAHRGNKNMSRSAKVLGRHNGYIDHFRNISSLYSRYNRDNWPKCTEQKFVSEFPCGFGVANKFRKMRHSSKTKVCFYYSYEEVNHATHLNRCKHLGQHTYTVCPADESRTMEAIALRLQHLNLWVDYNDIRSESYWYCADGRWTNTDFFSAGNPNNDGGNQNCAKIWNEANGFFDDDFCDVKSNYACLYDYNRDYKEKAALSSYPRDVEIGGIAKITCKVRSPARSINGLYVFFDSDVIPSTYFSKKDTRTSPKDPKMLWTYPGIQKIVEEDQEFFYGTLPVCLRRIYHTYYVRNINWDFLKFTTQCCSKHGCSSSVMIDIKVFPRSPQLDVAWPSETPGELYSGEYLIANCKAYVGGFRPVYMRFELKTKTKHYKWDIHPLMKIGSVPDWVQLQIFPSRDSCPRAGDGDIRDPETGACYHIITTKHTSREAYQLCSNRELTDLGFYWTLLYMKPDKRLFELITGHLAKNTRYWIGLTDSIVENQFLWSNGNRTLKGDWGDLWVESDQTTPDEWDCAFLDKEGIHVNQPCNLSLPLICNTQERLATSMLDFPTGIIDGPVYSINLKIKQRKSLHGSTLSCRSYSGSNRKVMSFVSRNDMELKKVTPELTFDWGTHKPSLQVLKNEVEGGSQVDATCETHIGNAFAVTWIFQKLSGAAEKWVVHLNGTIEGKSSEINVSMISAKESDEYGNDITSAMRFNFSKEYAGSSIKCLPYDERTVDPEDLHSHDKILISEYSFSLPSIEKKPFKAENRPMFLHLLLLMLIAVLAAVLLMKKDRTEAKAGPHHEQEDSKVATE